MRRFVLGVMIGAGSLAVADQLLDSGEPPGLRQATANEATRHEPGAIVDEGIVAPPSNSHQALPVAATTTAPATSSQPGNTNPWPSDDAAAARFCSAFHQRKHAEAEAEKVAEPKDVDWAYPTEQLLDQSVAAHPKSMVFRVATVDCRTTMQPSRRFARISCCARREKRTCESKRNPRTSAGPIRSRSCCGSSLLLTLRVRASGSPTSIAERLIAGSRRPGPLIR